MGYKKIAPILRIYLKDLKKRIRVEKAILFGSYALGKAGKDSDIDLVILSPDFEKVSVSDRFDILYHAREDPKTWEFGMDIFGYTPQEYENASSLTTLGEVKETGIEIQP